MLDREGHGHKAVLYKSHFLPLRHSFSQRHHCIHRLINHVYYKGQALCYSLPHDSPSTMVPVLWSLHYGPSAMVPALWSLCYGPSAMVPVLWSLHYGPSTMVPALWSQHYGPCTMVPVLWSQCYGPSVRA